MIIQFQVVQRVEGLCIYALDSDGKMYWAWMTRDGKVDWRPMSNLPDTEGVGNNSHYQLPTP